MRVRTRTLGVVFAPLFAIGVVIAACSSSNNVVEKGGECFLATDCAAGLVCVPQQNGARICTDDLSRVAGKPPPEAGAADAGDAAVDGDAATQPDTSPPVDAGQDTGVVTPVDSGQPPADAGEDG